jgi:AbrB family looped-hinge helix DNA binding protein
VAVGAPTGIVGWKALYPLPPALREVSSSDRVGRPLPWYYASMSVPQSKVTAQGQTSVPAEIRRKLGIGAGSVLEWREDGDRVVVQRAGRFSSEDIHRALFATRPKARKLAELKQAMARHAKAQHARD